MKNIVYCLLLLAGVNTGAAQSVCFTWKHDYGSAQDSRVRTLKHEVAYEKYQAQMQNKYIKYNREAMVARTLSRSATTSKQIEHQRLSNRIYKDRLYPIFDIKRTEN